jgi:hypothetical protein
MHRIILGIPGKKHTFIFSIKKALGMIETRGTRSVY